MFTQEEGIRFELLTSASLGVILTNLVISENLNYKIIKFGTICQPIKIDTFY
jgi:hypothetical protein